MMTAPEMLEFFVSATSEFVGRENVNPLALTLFGSGAYRRSRPVGWTWGFGHVKIR